MFLGGFLGFHGGGSLVGALKFFMASFLFFSGFLGCSMNFLVFL